MKITVPATVGDFGPGKASLGFALDRYMTVEVLEERDTWLVEHNLGENVPADEHNYMVAVARNLAPNLVAHHVKVTSDIPQKQGLGSSTAALLAGIELANQLGGLGLDDYTKLTLAARTEGQPANVTAALLGGMTTSYLENGDVFASGVVAPAYQAVVYVPAAGRTESPAQPAAVDRATATAHGAAGNMLLAAWQSQQLELAGRLLEVDYLDAPASAALTAIRQASHALEVYGTFQAGQGPAIVTLVAPEQVQDLLDVLAYVDGLDGELFVADLAANGVQVTA